MNVVVPFTKLHPLVLPVLRADGLTPLPKRLEGEFGYFDLMAELWRRGDSFVVVEQDILPWPGAVRELWECPCEWGAYSYRYHGGIGIAHMLGCTKITDRLMARLPDLWKGDLVPWHMIDQHLFFGAREVSQEPHLHRPGVIHLNMKELENVG